MNLMNPAVVFSISLLTLTVQVQAETEDEWGNWKSEKSFEISEYDTSIHKTPKLGLTILKINPDINDETLAQQLVSLDENEQDYIIIEDENFEGIEIINNASDEDIENALDEIDGEWLEEELYDNDPSEDWQKESLVNDQENSEDEFNEEDLMEKDFAEEHITDEFV